MDDGFFRLREQDILDVFRDRKNILDCLDNLPESLCLALVKLSSANIQYIENPSHEIKMQAIESTENSISFIRNLTEEEQLEIVKMNPYYFSRIKTPTENLVYFMLENYPNLKLSYALDNLVKPSPELRKVILKTNGWYFTSCPDLSEEEFLIAFETILFREDHNDFFETLLRKFWGWRLANRFERIYFPQRLSFSSKRKLREMIKQYKKLPIASLKNKGESK